MQIMQNCSKAFNTRLIFKFRVYGRPLLILNSDSYFGMYNRLYVQKFLFARFSDLLSSAFIEVVSNTKTIFSSNMSQ